MSNDSNQEKTFLHDSITTFCHCWKMIRVDGTITGYTDHDTPLFWQDVLYEPLTGFNASEVKKTLGFSIDTVDIEAALSSSGISEQDIAKGLFDRAKIETFLVDWLDPTFFQMTNVSMIGKIKCIDGHFIAELESPIHLLDRVATRYIMRSCDAELGDQRCRVQLSQPNFESMGTIVAVKGKGFFCVSGLENFSSEWFSEGCLYWLDTKKNKKPHKILKHFCEKEKVYLDVESNDEFDTIAQGEKFKIFAGCNKTFSTCCEKFKNAFNFRGFPHLPGNDAAYSYANGMQEFDGRAIV